MGKTICLQIKCVNHKNVISFAIDTFALKTRLLLYVFILDLNNAMIEHALREISNAVSDSPAQCKLIGLCVLNLKFGRKQIGSIMLPVLPALRMFVLSM